MELDILTPENCISLRAESGKPRVSITKNGKLAFNNVAAKKLNFTTGMKIAVGNNPKTKHDFYLIVVPPNGVGFQAKAEKSNWFSIQNASLCKKIREALEAEHERTFEGTLRFVLGGQSMATGGGKSLTAYTLAFKVPE